MWLIIQNISRKCDYLVGFMNGQIRIEAAIHWQVKNFYDSLDKDDKDVALKSWKFTYFGIDYQNIAANYWIFKNIHFPIF